MTLDRLQAAGRIVIGTKQTTKAVKTKEAKFVFVAQDAESRIVNPIVDLCREQQIEVIEVPQMVELGKACGIKVGAAMAAVIEE
ncbi:MAG: 50S ribosomal protein L7Ae-like protein [Firmicutes bacterium HGW-Firmicutes-13]|nr:MAG: 50S ribosomal protein L7Ae-like protein [Firmicutes bacterium HGW-Firmicutes-13]